MNRENMYSHPLANDVEKEAFIVERIVFAIKKAASCFRVDHQAILQGITPQVHINKMTEDAMVTLVKFMLENKAPVTVDTQSGTISCLSPKTVWQHFKLKHMPAWFSRWFPVVMEERHHIYTSHYTTNVTRFCPHANLAWERHREDHIEFLRAGREIPDADPSFRNDRRTRY